MSDSTFRPTPGAWYTLEFRGFSYDTPFSGGGKWDNCRVRVPSESQENGKALEGIFCNSESTPGQPAQWSFDEVEPGWFVITVRHSGKVLDVRNASVENETVLQQLTRHAPDSPHRFAQHFSVNLVDKDTSQYGKRYVIRSRRSEKVLTFKRPNVSTDILSIVQRAYTGSEFQFLAIDPASPSALVPDPDLYYRIRNVYTGKVFDIADGFQNGSLLSPVEESSNLRLTQQWRFEAVEPGWYMMHVRHTDKVLVITAASLADGADMHQWPRDGSKNQQWKITWRREGYTLTNRNSGKYPTWGGTGEHPADGEIRQYPNRNNREQSWFIEPVETKPFRPQPGVYYTLTFVHSGHAVAVEDGKAEDNVPAVQIPVMTGQPHAQWRFEEVLKDFYLLVARHSDKVLALASESTNEGIALVQQSRGTSMGQHWSLHASPAGLVVLNRFSNRALDVVGDSTAAFTPLQQTAYLLRGNHTVSATPVATPDFKPRSDAWYVLRFAHSGKILTVSLGSSANGATVWQAFDNGGHHQHWRLTEVEPGWYILTARHSGKALELSNGSTSDGAKIQQWTRQDTNQNQHWALVPTPYGWALRARKSGKPIEVPNYSQSHGTLIAQGSTRWERNQSVSFEVYVSDATLATPVVRYTAPSLLPSAVGVDSGTATGGTATAAPTTSTTVPAAVTANSPVSASVFFVPFSLPLAFTGAITSQVLSAGQRFVGPAQLPAPFNTAVDSLSLLVSTDPVGAALTFQLPSSCSLKSVIENEISSKISDSTLRDIVNNTLKPFAALLPTPTVILSTIEGEDENFGSYMAGFNAFASLSIADIPPFNVLHSLFPSAGLESRSLTLGIGTNGATAASAREFWVSGNAWLDMPLIPSFLTLKEISLSLNKAATSVNTSGELVLSLKVPGEELSLRGGIDTTIEAGVSQSTVWAALDADDGMWENAFGIPGVNVAGMGIQITSGGGIGVRGELHFGNGLLGARVGILVDPTSPQNSILDIYSEEGLQLPRLLSPLLGSLVDLKTVCDVALTELQLYVAPSGGSIAGQDYAQGTTIGGKLHLWGWDAAAQGTVTSNSIDIQAQADPLRLKAGSVSFLDFTAASDPNKGPSFQFTLSNKKFGGNIDTAVSLLGGAIKGSLLGTVNARGFSGTLTAGAGAGLGIYAATQIVMEQGLFRLAFKPTIGVYVSVAGYRATLSVSTTIAVEVSSTRFSQSISFSFSAMGKTYKPGPFGVSVPFASADDLAKAFYEYAADLLANELTETLRQAADAAFSWVKAWVTSIIDDAAQLFSQIGVSASRVADGFKNGWNAGAEELARVMRGVYGWTINQTGDYLRSAYDLSKGALAGALHNAGYTAKEVENLFKSWGGDYLDWMEDNLNPANWW